MNIKQKVMPAISRFVGAVARRKKLLVLGAFACGALGAIPVFALGGHQLVEVVDSAAFCTNVCHDVHKAEAITYKVSPHSEVACAKCHVGEGTSNLIGSKLRGMKDILPTFTNSYHKPILTPLDDLRPSTETCETCHWSQKFSGDVPVIKTSYKSDHANTKNTVALVLKLGGGSDQVAAGVHWHATAKIWYLPVDDQRREIAWVATEDSSGNVTEYVDPNRVGEITPELIAAKKRQMDCVDCHNRVTHLFRSPDELINNAITDGSIDIKLPYIKAQSMAALDPQSKTLDEANAKVEAIRDFYKANYPDVIASKSASLDKAIAHLKEIAKLTTFEDGLDWNTHPDNAVHNEPNENMLVDWQSIAQNDQSSGCFRCHGNLMKVENTGELHIDEALNSQNIDQFVARVNRTLDDVAKAPPVLSIDEVTSRLKALAAADNATASSLNGSSDRLFVSANATVPAPENTPTAAEIADNITALIPVGAYPADFVLPAECESCHHTVKSGLISPLAPAVSHPVDGLDNCLGCHSPTSAKPFKTTHPWTTNEACNSCHESAPKLKGLAVGLAPAEAKDIPHGTKGLEECFVCHGPGNAQALKAEHPWATIETCSSCHYAAGTVKAIPLSAPPKTPSIAHPVKGYEDCLSCHGQPTIMPFKTEHPWSTNQTCASCHKEGALALDATHSTAYTIGPKIAHSTSGMEECSGCHRPSTGHPWTSNQLCTKCHQPYGVGGSGGAGGGAAGGAASATTSAPPPTQAIAILHPIAGLENCLACHDIGNVRPFPTNHVGRPNSMCLICHKQAPLATVPGAPGALAATATSAGQVNLTWTDSAAGATGHRIERATNNAFTADLLSRPGTATTGFSDATTFGNTNYYYRVYASNSAGESAASNTANVTTPASTVTAPAAASGVTATVVSSSQVNLSWIDNATTETGYRVDRATNSGFTGAVTVNIAANSVTHSDSGLAAGTVYYYRVYAFNSAGNSAAATPTPASVTTQAASQVSFAATIQPMLNQNCNSCHSTQAPRLDTYANVYSARTLLPGTMSASYMTPAQRQILADWISQGALNDAVAVPSAPTSLVAAAGAGQVNLTWAHSGTTETGFRVQRATAGDFATGLTDVVTTGANVLSYSDTSVIGSTLYYYRVYAVNASGNSAASPTASVTTLPATVPAPAAPSALIATVVSASQVNLTWLDNATTETGYRIDRATNAIFTAGLVMANIPANLTTYSDISVAAGTPYYYRVYAFNSAGNSAAATPNPPFVTTPAAVIDPAALYSSNCAGCHGATRQGNSASALTSAALAGRTLAQVNSTITNGTTGMPAYSATLSSAQIAALAQSLKGTPPAAPGGLTATAVGAGQVNLTWVDNSADETGFRIERASNSGFTVGVTTVFATAANAVSYSNTGLIGSTTYYYRVYAVNGSGESAASPWASATTAVATVTAPTAPTGLTATAASDTQVNLTWLDNATTETGYRVDRATTSGFTAGLVTVNIAANLTTYSDSGLAASTPYYYRVYAFNSAGNSAAATPNPASVTTQAAGLVSYTATIQPMLNANCVSCHATQSPRLDTYANVYSARARLPGMGSGYLTTPQEQTLAAWISQGALNDAVAVPSAPTSLVAAAGAGQVNLTWAHTGTTETGFRVQRAANSGFTAGLTNVGTTGANVVSYSDTGVIGSTLYYYRVYAVNASGDSAASPTASVTTLPATVPAPAAPTGLTATATSATQVNLTWLDVATTETGYRVDRATNSGFTAGLVTISNIAANAVSYSDTGLAAGTVYYYRVYAFNSAGNSAAATPNPASVTTQAAALVSFSATIQPMFTQACNRSGCHPTAGVTLSTYAQISARATNLGMGSSRLTAAQKTTLANWVSQGMPNN